jgi:YgiT-type zinc finger domain-containing protein
MAMSNTCPECGGEKADGKTTFTVEFETGVLVVRDVPAKVCQQCGEEWIDDSVASELESLARKAKEKQSELEMVPFSELAG